MAQAPIDLAPPLASVLARYESPMRSPAPQRRKPGRPAKRTREYLAGLLNEHTRLVAWFAERFGAQPASDKQLYTEFFAYRFMEGGERAGRAKSSEFQRALKTLRNELAEARRLERESPENLPISGTPSRV